MSTGADSTAASSSVADPTPFKCAQCLMSFENNALQRDHMRSEWHIHNLKRRIASLEPLPEAVFEKQILATQRETEESAENVCHICGRGYNTSRQYQSHLKSQNHLRNTSKTENNSDALSGGQRDVSIEKQTCEGSSTESGEDYEDYTDASEADFDPSECLFCNKELASVEDNINHMHRAHGMFIPNQDHLIDLESFLGYLSLLISDFHQCLYCGAVKTSPEASQHHMMDKGHCKINVDCASSLSEFYNHPESDSETPEPRPGNTALHLSSGKNISHRLAVPHPHPHRFSTSTAYSSSAQHLLADSPTTDSSGPVLTSSSSHNIKALTSRSSDTRALLGISAIQKRSLQAVEQKMLKMATRARNNYQRKVEATGNKQKYFKPDVPGPLNG